MGIAICPERSIDAVTPESILATGSAMRVPQAMIHQFSRELSETVEDALAQASLELENNGFPVAKEVADAIIADMQPRLEVLEELLRS